MTHVFGSDFRQERKHGLRTLFERPKSGEIRKSEKCRNKHRKKCLLGAFETAKLSSYQGSDWKFYTHIHRQVFFHIYLGLLKIQKIGYLKSCLFSQFYNFSKTPKSEIAV